MPCFDLGDSKMRGRCLSFFKECFFRVRVSVNPKTVFFKKKKRQAPTPSPRFTDTPLTSSCFQKLWYAGSVLSLSEFWNNLDRDTRIASDIVSFQTRFFFVFKLILLYFSCSLLLILLLGIFHFTVFNLIQYLKSQLGHFCKTLM